MDLRYICAQPTIPYYLWQVEVLINNFIETGIKPNQIDIVCLKTEGGVPEDWVRLVNHYNTVRFFFYDDTRKTKNYTSSIRPNMLKQHWLARPEIWGEAIFYHDCDIAFTKPINWEQFLGDDNWYGSDTKWYISHDYIISKGEDVLDKMCSVVGIDKQVVKNNELNSIGAQYILKDIDWKFWDDVERDSENLYSKISKYNKRKIVEMKDTNPLYNPLQIWCADMWAVLWNGWKRGKKTICHDDLNFSWGTSNKRDWDRFNIFHNAGVTSDKYGLFYKPNYMNKLPYLENLEIKPNTASREYWKLIQRVGKKSCLINNEKINEKVMR